MHKMLMFSILLRLCKVKNGYYLNECPGETVRIEDCELKMFHGICVFNCEHICGADVFTHYKIYLQKYLHIFVYFTFFL